MVSGDTTNKQKYLENLPSGEIPKYLDHVTEELPGRIPKNAVFKRRQTAWEFMGQEPPKNYIRRIQGLAPGRVAETATGSASAEVVDVDAKVTTLSEIEIQAVRKHVNHRKGRKDVGEF